MRCRDLVAVKSARVEQAFRGLGLNLSRGRTTHMDHSCSAWQRGKTAGEAVRFLASVDGAGRIRVIGVR